MRSPDSVDGERTFGELWQAQAFALAVALHERGVFSWPEWTAQLAAGVATDVGESETEDYRRWLAALERIVEDKHIADRPTLVRYREAWRRAAARTPHGTPIELDESDFD